MFCGLQSIYRDFGVEMAMEVRSDATAAIVARTGFGRVQHLAVSDLWIQQVARRKTVICRKVDGSLNPADMLAAEESSSGAAMLCRSSTPLLLQ